MRRKPRVTSHEKPLRSPGGATLRSSRIIVVAFLAFASLAAFFSPAHAAGPIIHIVIAEKADPLEKFAADEVAGQLKKLFEAETTIAAAAPSGAEHVVLLGNPATHAVMKDLNPKLPKLSDDGHALKSMKLGERSLLVIAGGSPRAVLWGAYELGWQFGIRYFLFGDLYPTSPRPFTLDGFDSGERELGRTRFSQGLDMASPVGEASWGADELRRHLGQLAKLKIRSVGIYGSWDDAVAYSAALRLPVDGDTAGRSAFAGKKYFENPDLAATADDKERCAAARKVFDDLQAESTRLQMACHNIYRTIDNRTVKSNARLLPTLSDVRLLADARNRPDYEEPEAEFYAELLTPVCGEEVSVRVEKGFGEVYAAQEKIEANDENLDILDPQVLLRHFESDEPPPAWWSEVRTNYLNAMNEMYRANTRAREGGRQFTLWYARRFEFAMEYMNVVEALRKAGIAKRKGNKDEQIAELEKALDSLTAACNAMAAVARSQSDRGIIAVMNEYGYRPVTKLLEEADASN